MLVNPPVLRSANKYLLRGILPLMVAMVLGACKNETLFESLPAEKTGIRFVNQITENDTLNILDFEYVYNGGGVGIGDFDHNGLPDVYFTGNQVPNQLYLNKGDFEFDDVTTASGTTANGKWCSGVAVVDINNDGWLDLYVCANVKGKDADRANLLYVNQGLRNGVPVFKEMAAEYGVADTGYSTHAVFFDYDNDGDLDLYVLTNKIAADRKPSIYRPKVTDGSSPTTDRLYRNDWNVSLKHGVYTDVSKQAGILIEGYGLGVNVCDINQDGWKDLYVTNDYVTNDLVWVNNHNGTFTNRAAEYLKHTSHSAMGNDVADVNNDGLPDIVAVDMMPEDNYRKKMFLNPNSYQTYLNNDLYGYEYQYVRNTLQLNQGKLPSTQQPIFSDISMLAGIAETDWSWTPMVVDFDNDGFRDLIITNGFPKDVTDHDFIQYQSELSFVATKEILLSKIPAVKLNNYAFRNNGNLTFSNVSKDWGITEPSFSNGAAYADFDADGDLDYVVNNINDPASVYRNNSQEQAQDGSRNFLRINFKGDKYNLNGLGAVVTLTYNSTLQTYEHTPYRGYLSSVEPVAHFGVGSCKVIDEVKVKWPNGKTQTLKKVPANQVLELKIDNAFDEPTTSVVQAPLLLSDVSDSLGVAYRHTELDYIDFNIQKLIPHKLSQYGPSLAVGDVNADGLDDVFVSGSRYRKGQFLVQTSTGGFRLQDLLPEADSTQKSYEDAGSLLFDADADGDLDLYIVSGGYEVQPTEQGYQDRLYLNNGKGLFARAMGALPAMLESGSCVKAADYDRDGDLDLFVGGRVKSTQYPLPVSSTILRNDSKAGVPKFTDVSNQVAKELKDIGMICDALWTDFDNDGWTDLLLSGEWMPPTFLKNTQGRFSKVATGLEQYLGLWTSLLGGDFDADGDTDYLLGNQGLNTLYRVSEAEPMRLYAKDFDNNGNYDAIPTVYYPDSTGERKEFPYNVREDMIKQMISTRAKFPTFGQYARAGIEQLLTEAERKDAMVLSANYLQSSYLQNLGGGKFELKALPVAAQFAPIFGMLAEDLDLDGHLDAILVGNDFGCELLQGRQDALNGLVLKGDGKGGFVALSIQQSGFCPTGDAKALVRLTNAGGRNTWVVSQNKSKLKFYQRASSAATLKWQPLDAVALLKYADGRIQRQELYHGQSFYSQSARNSPLSSKVVAVEVIDFRGKKRTIKP